ncbi:MAG: hypothetical protein P1U77_05945 [Rubripirellula sp.]|nr:hypothetical protein [Planctomycetaceae bacterium]MDF1840958.1 hypothetical protein [Rubripirellula sp.]
MKKTDNHSRSQPLELTAPIWIGMAIVVLLGVVNQWRQFNGVRTLNPTPALEIKRHLASTHQFPGLGVEIALPEGWAYLSVTEDTNATAATLVHSVSQSIVSFRANRLEEWPPKGHATKEDTFENIEIDWVSLKVPRIIRLDDGFENGAVLQKYAIAWIDLDPRRLGRLIPRGERQAESTRETRDLIMILVNHQRGDEISSAVRELCNSIRFLDASS